VVGEVIGPFKWGRSRNKAQSTKNKVLLLQLAHPSSMIPTLQHVK
jgi:hypothetical protein